MSTSCYREFKREIKKSFLEEVAFELSFEIRDLISNKMGGVREERVRLFSFSGAFLRNTEPKTLEKVAQRT